MSSTLPTVLIFLAVTLVGLGIASLLADMFVRDRSRLRKRVAEEFGRGGPERDRRPALFRNLSPAPVDFGEEEVPGWRKRFEMMVEQSDLRLNPQQLMLLMAGCGVVPAGLAVLLGGSLLVGVCIGLVGAALPLGYVSLKWRARQEKLLARIPDAFELMARVIRAGQTMAQALQAVADEFEPPISTEFAYCYEQQNLGLPFESALRDLAQRTGLLEIKVLVLALLVQQETGGNLAQLLENLGGIVRSRLQIRGKVKVLTAEGRMQAAVLLALPFVAFGAMMVVNRPYALVLLQHPYLVLAMVVSMTVGALWIRRIVNFDF